MILEDLIPHLLQHRTLGAIYSDLKIASVSEAILIYMKDRLAIESDIVFFEIEETDDEQYYTRDGVDYVQLFPVELAIEFLDMLNLRRPELTPRDIAIRLIEYRLNDA